MIFECFSVALAQNNETKKYLNLLGVKKIKLLGNLKFSETKIKIKKLIKNLRLYLETLSTNIQAKNL